MKSANPSAENEISKGNENVLPTLSSPHFALRFHLQEGKGEGFILGCEATGKKEARLRWPEVPRIGKDRQDHQEGDVEVKV